jgi:hypothetical protein
MTYIELDEAPTDEAELALSANQTVKCSWCGEIIRLDGSELALAMCQTCYDQMLAEFLRAQHEIQSSKHDSDR